MPINPWLDAQGWADEWNDAIEAVRAAVAPTVLALQTSAFALLDRLIEVQNDKAAA